MTGPNGNNITRVLLVEPDEEQAEAIFAAFAGYGPVFGMERVSNLREARAAIGIETPDLVISESRLEDGRSIELLPARAEARTFPLVVLSHREDTRSAVEAMRAGAVDYVVKTGYTLSNLPVIANRSIAEWRRWDADRRRRAFNERAARVLDYLPEFVGIADSDGRLLFVNRTGRSMLGARPEEDLAGERLHTVFPDWQVGDFVYPGASETGGEVRWTTNARMKTRSGEEVAARHAVFACVSPKSEVEYFAVLARSERNGTDRKD